MTTALRIIYAGTPEFAVPALLSIVNSQHQLVAVLTQPDRQSGRGRKVTESAVKKAVKSGNVEILQPENVNSEDTIMRLNELAPDLMIVAAFGQLFSAEVLNIPRYGCINIHASLLPRWRGASPIQHAILAGDARSGISIMQMTRAMDAGDIWLQADCPIAPDDTAQSLHNKLADLGGKVILEAISQVTGGQHTPRPQDQQNVTYCSKLKKTDGLIDWDRPAKIILRKIRAYYPWPGAFTSLNGRRLKITLAESAGTVIDHAQPGEICGISKTGIMVAAAEGTAICIKQLVPEGGKNVSAADFSHSNILENQRLGS